MIFMLQVRERLSDFILAAFQRSPNIIAVLKVMCKFFSDLFLTRLASQNSELKAHVIVM
jgi:hypothetical protein